MKGPRPGNRALSAKGKPVPEYQRAYITHLIETRTLADLAIDVGTTPATLAKALRGGTCYQKTLTKIASYVASRGVTS